MRPLDRITSIKLKLSIVIVAVVAITAAVSTIGFRAGLPLWLRPLISVGIALLLVYPFSRGITSPLREMVAATRAMAAGDYEHPVTATSQDEVGELARAFNAMRPQLAEAERQQKDLVANVSHELRTPLAILRARFENMVDGVEEPDPESLRSSLAEIERLSALVDQLLDLSRIDSGASPLHVSTFDLTEVLRHVATSAGATDPDVSVVVECAGPVPYRGDEARLGQVVANLVHNAACYSHEGTQVTVAAAPTPDGIELTVSDRGPGIPPEERSRVFDRFYRSDHATATRRGGTGLGLAIVRGIIDLHGGSIEIRSNTPTGCRVVAALPHQPEAL